MSLAIRQARPGEGALVLGLVKELAEYEKLVQDVDATVDQMEAALFDAAPRVFCDLAEWQGEVAGLAIWFYSFSTFRGRYGIYLEDLFVRPHLRGRGIGKALLSNLAGRCVAQGLPRLEWSVLDWNEPAISFYKSCGADLMEGWTTCRLSGDALACFGKDRS